MILLFLLVLGAFLLPVVNIFCKGKKRAFLTFLVSIIFSGSICLVVLNQYQHLGMKKVTTTKEVTLKSSSEEMPMEMLLYQPLGNGEEKVYLYHTDKKEKELLKTGQEKVSNQVLTNQSQEKLVTKQTEWVYQSDFLKLFFSVEKEPTYLVQEENTFYLPKKWLELSVDETKKLGEELTNNEAKMKQEGQIWVGEELKKELTKNPKMTEKEQQEEMKKLSQDYKIKVVKEILEK